MPEIAFTAVGIGFNLVVTRQKSFPLEENDVSINVEVTLLQLSTIGLTLPKIPV